LHARLACVLLLLAVAAVPAQGGDETPQDQLEALVDLPTAPLRWKRADALARRKGIDVDAWLEAMEAFGRFHGAGRGIHTDLVELDGEAIMRGRPSARTEITFYVPELYDRKKPAPLLLTLHGSGTDGRSDPQRWRAVADTLGMIVVSPTDPRGIQGFTKSEAERKAVWVALRWARRTFNIDECRIYATGISRGGHLLWDVALRTPDRFAAIAPMIGGPLVSLQRGANNVRYAENLVDVPIRDLQGSKDDSVLVANLRLTFARLASHGAKDAQLIEFPELGHAFDFEKVDWIALFHGTRRPRIPPRVIRRTARKGEGRAHWVEILDTRSPVAETFQLRVDPAVWRGMTADARRAEVVQQAEARTARVQARFLGAGRIAVTTKHVKKLRLLLTRDMLPAQPGPMEVTVNGKSRKVRARENKRVLLREFAERFDRTFLPVAEIVLKP